jgi:wyosine [tRNA(Phe)-imidazoG37] synthetase (radical SAM superfamily)
MKYVYGPVVSRRLGFSLGVSLTPYKFCSLDCVYCQLGPTNHKTLQRSEYISQGEILQELGNFFSNNKQLKIDYITFSGFGEPLLNVNISTIIAEIRKLSDKKIALITNGTLFIDKKVRTNVLALDLIVPSLDAASQAVFEKIDRPAAGINIEEVIEGLADLRKEFNKDIWLEIMLVKGLNDTEQELTLLKKAAQKIGPDKIQLNTPIRAPQEFAYKVLDKKRLEAIREFFGLKAEII